MTNPKETIKTKLESNRGALAAVAGLSLLMSVVYYRGKSEGKIVILIDEHSDGSVTHKTIK